MPNDEPLPNQHPDTNNVTVSDTTEHADLHHRIEADTHEVKSGSSSTVNPVRDSSQIVSESLPTASPGLMVLQWLVYAFWGWTMLALAGLILLVLTTMFNQDTSSGSYSYMGGGVAYLLAAVIVLFIISLVTDIFYSRAERKHSRKGGTSVIMIIHAVLFALCAIGSLIAAVFGGVQLLIGSASETAGPLSAMIGWSVIALLYGATLLRVLRPKWLKGVVVMYWTVMTLASVTAVTLGVVGPAVQARLQAQDVVIEDGLPRLADAINEYAKDNGKLPDSLEDVKPSGTSSRMDNLTKLINEDLVEYSKGEQLASSRSTSVSRLLEQDIRSTAVFHYELCVDYATSDSSGYADDFSLPQGQRYGTSISTYGHRAGNVCYDLQTDYSY